MKQWTYPLDHKVFFRAGTELPNGLTAEEKEKRKVSINLITNETLLKWLDAYCPPSDWIIELTGGEPGLYPEINSLIPALCARDYRGLIKTNGTFPIPKTDSFKLITAWHESVKEIPPFYDVILIIKNPDDDWRGKKEYCIKNNIPYKCVPFDRSYMGYKSNSGLPSKTNKIEGMTRILSMGQITPCYTDAPCEGYDIFAMKPPKIKKVREVCPKCGNVAGVEDFLPKGFL
jgi:hypothetical protein